MFKFKQKLTTVLMACVMMLIAMVMAMATLVAPANVTASAATTVVATFEFGANGTASHSDGSSASSYSETNNGYTLTLSSMSNVYKSARDAKGNSCLKLGASSKAGSFNFTVADDITKVIIYVAKYKSNTSKVEINSETTTLTKNSNDGAYDAITVDTSATKTVSLTTVSGGYRAMVNTIEFVKEASTEPDCAHEGETEWTYDSENKEHYEKCLDCEAEIDGSREACSSFAYSEYTTSNGVHTRTATCTVCGGEQTESGDCDVTAEYVREGNQHTQTGTCSICGYETTVTEDCTLSYKNVSNDDGTHNTTSTCSVCSQSATTENVACSFEKVLNDTTWVYTCEYCEYSYTEEATTYTVTYSVPANVAAVDPMEIVEGYTAVLPTAEAYDKYTFVGWLNGTYEQNTAAPNYLEAGDEYEVTEDVTLYALYTFAEGETAESWNLVTAANQLAVGKQIVIVASGSDYALGTNQATNNRTAVAVTKGEGTVEIGDDVQVITLEAGTEEDTFAFNVGNGYLYAASSTSNYLKTQTTNNANGSWSILVTSAGVATIKAQGTNTRNWLRKNSNSALFSCYTSGQQDVSIYVKEGGATVYYTTSFESAHEHVGTIVETDDATCTETGMERTSCECGHIISEVEIPALGHEYDAETNLCIRCNEQDPETIDYSGYYYFSFTHSETVYYVDNSEQSSGRYFARTEAPTNETIEAKYVFRLVKTATGIYSIYELDGTCYAENAIVEKVGDVYRFYDSEARENQFLLNAGSSTKYVKFYKTTNAANSNYSQDITLTPVDLSVKIDSASITIGADLTVNYKVSMPAVYADATMYFTVNGATYDVAGTLVGEQYVFSLALPPQYMATNVKAELKLDEIVLATMENYSVKQYAQNKLNAAESSDELKRLLSDMLYYGAAAQIYKEFNVENLATNGVENILPALETKPDATDFELENNEEITEYPAYFKGAGVYFDNVNKIYVKLNTTENVTLTINDVEVEVTGTTVYTDGILATGFATTYTFVLSCDGVVMQTLTYSVNAYAYAKNDDATMGDLALALYRYGVSAAAYNA